ncbi:MAG: hypothetical protein HOD72_03170 [Opitutae bacterium]|jgi:hypothetical protein|nr:hypothetical protein [Opitutae bacterium]MBT4223447.1 hypothetical protein [Opitutae bacterium]MBT5378284.1 hypothetical protein [Opitutae bacterium]MBT5691827.1 hypothetical protein [Opitutae bacterium]MBT6957519.1 hypothetical protein [Opitutae bacterium]
MEWIDTWDCKSCGADNSESKEACHKCGSRRKRLIKVAMVPWILAILVFGGIGLIKVYLDNNEKAGHGEHAEGNH